MLSGQLDLVRIVIGPVLAVILAVISYRLKALSLSGAIGTIVVGSVVFGLGGLLCAAPLLFFFIVSSWLSRLKSDIKMNSLKAADKTGPRDVYQVFANGGVATICVIIMLITGDQLWFFLFLTGLCASTADTWATEIGTLFSSRPVSIVTFKPVRPGQSGGVSVIGTLASLLGAVLTMAAAYLTAVIGGLKIGSTAIWLTCAMVGFGGSLVDSILGATVQAQSRCQICGSVTEKRAHCGREAEPIKGIKIINNDMVNLLSNLVAMVMVFILIFAY